MTARIAIVDYGMGNRRSVFKALERAGTSPTLTSDKMELRESQGLVVPGVGAFPEAMNRLHQLGLAQLICDRARDGIPVLGICLGMQLLFDSSEELGHTSGLGLIDGEVTRLRTGGLPLPHIGWSEVELLAPSPLTDGLPASSFYHVHSLAPRPARTEDVIGVCEYGERFATIVRRGAVFGVQFHPEKSSSGGLALLERFIALCTAGSAAPQAVVTP